MAGNDNKEPSRILAIDVGAGTQDILLYESDQPIENCVKLVVPCQSVVVARRIAQATRRRQDVVLDGFLMGGGACARAAQRHIADGLRVYATEQAAKTFFDDLDRVRQMGVLIVDAVDAIIGDRQENTVRIETKDVDIAALSHALEAFEVEIPDQIAVAVQDHGECVGGSNREFRMAHFRDFARDGGNIRDLAFTAAPEYLTRMRAVQASVPNCVVMDTGPAAIWGALFDATVAKHSAAGVIVVNAGNAHTFGALLQGQRIWGLFEHHTGAMTSAKLADYVERLRAGTLPHEEVLTDGGHGAYTHPSYRPSNGFRFVSITGPNRAIACDLGYHFAAPFGDMMLTGCFGLVAARLELERVAAGLSLA